MNRLAIKVNYKTGRARLYDPDTGKHFDNMVIDWDANAPNIFQVEILDGLVTHVKNPWASTTTQKESSGTP